MTKIPSILFGGILSRFGWSKNKAADKPKILFLRRSRRIYVFPLTCAAEKHLISEKPLIKRFFKDTGVVLAGIECSQKSLIFANGIPAGERVEFFDTLKAEFCNATFIGSIINVEVTK